MKETLHKIREKLKDFVESGEDTYFSSEINSLYNLLINSNVRASEIEYTFEELHSFSNQLIIAVEDEDIQKYYLLSLQRLDVLERKYEQVNY
jgi:hypothetical protein